MRAAALSVLQCNAAGLSRDEILMELKEKGIFLPDPEAFIDGVLAANAKKHGHGDTADTRSGPAERPAWLTGLGAFALAAVPSWITCLVLWKVAHAIAPLGGIIGGAAVGLAFTYLVKDREPDVLFSGAVLGSAAFLLSALLVGFLGN